MIYVQFIIKSSNFFFLCELPRYSIGRVFINGILKIVVLEERTKLFTALQIEQQSTRSKVHASKKDLPVLYSTIQSLQLFNYASVSLLLLLLDKSYKTTPNNYLVKDQRFVIVRSEVLDNIIDGILLQHIHHLNPRNNQTFF